MRTLLFLLAIFIALSSLKGTASIRPLAELEPHKPILYLGIDAQKRYMGFDPGYGDNLLYHTFPQGNVYVGVRFLPNWAIELGYESTVTRFRINTLTAGDIAAGTLIPRAISPVIFMSKITVQDTHLSLVRFYPLFSYRNVPIELFGSVGVAFLKATVERETISIAGYPRHVTRTLVGRKPVVRLAVGIEAQLHERLSLRASVGWVNTSRVTLIANDNIFGMYLPTIKPKNTMFFGVGLVWKFC